MSFHYYGRAEEAAKRIMDLFQSGDVPAALAPIFIRRHDNTPCRGFTLSLAFDHRVLDGAMASEVLALVKDRLESWEMP